VSDAAPVRLLHISSATEWRGGEAQAFYLMRGLRRKDHQVLLIAPEQSPLLTKATAEGCAPLPLSIRSDADFGAFFKLKRLISRMSPHVVHAHDAHAHAAAVWARFFGAPWKLVVSRRVSYEPKAHPFNKFKYGPRVDCFIAVSRTIEKQLLSLGVEVRRVVTVRSGIEIERFQQVYDTTAWKQAHDLPLDKQLIGVVASLSPQKEQEVFLRAACRLAKTRDDLHFVLVGEGAARSLLERLVVKLGIEKLVTFTGFVEDIVPAYQSLRVAVLPSSAGEGSPAAIKEAITSGVAVVAIDESNAREIVDHGVNGILVPPKNDEVMAKMILMVLNDPELYGKLAANACQSVADFDIQKMIEGTEEVYLRLIGARKDEES
jgi:glycosyltransferase involved in cell wall biosynthesis